MDKRSKELRAELAGNPDISILDERRWRLPVVLFDVTFGRVKRLKMDILMKMLLLAFQETPIRRAAALADMLFVEEVFIRDLIEKMERTGLIGLGRKGYELTDKGYAYLKQGIFEEEMEAETAIVSYSAVHDRYRLIDEEAKTVSDDKLPLYRYAAEGKAEPQRILERLSEEKNAAEDTYQVVVTEVIKLEELRTDSVPCTEFQLYDRKQDIFFARVWNAGTNSYDETIEKQIEEREIVAWREKMEQEKLQA